MESTIFFAARSTFARENTLPVPPPTAPADVVWFTTFTATPLSGPAPLTVSFADTSFDNSSQTATINSGGGHFGDGSPPLSCSGSQCGGVYKTTHTYNHPGLYTVTFQTGGTNSGSAQAAIVVQTGGAVTLVNGGWFVGTANTDTSGSPCDTSKPVPANPIDSLICFEYEIANLSGEHSLRMTTSLDGAPLDEDSVRVNYDRESVGHSFEYRGPGTYSIEVFIDDGLLGTESITIEE